MLNVGTTAYVAWERVGYVPEALVHPCPGNSGQWPVRCEGQITKQKSCANEVQGGVEDENLTHTRGLGKDFEISLLNIITPHYWCFTEPNFYIYLGGFIFFSTVSFWYKSHADKTRLIKVSNYLSSQHDQWQMECIFLFLPAKKKKKKKKRSSLMQDTKIFWFIQVLGTNLHGRALTWEGDVTSSPSKADFASERPSAGAKSKDCRASLQRRHLRE